MTRTWVGLGLSLGLGVGLFLACAPAAAVPPSAESLPPPSSEPRGDGAPDAGGGGAPDAGGGGGAPDAADARRAWLRRSFYAGVAPGGLAVGDFNEDGAPDVVVNARGRGYLARYSTRIGELPLLLNDGKGHLAMAGEPPRHTSSGRVVAGDLDGDGHLDALAGTRDGVRLLFGHGDGTLRGGPETFGEGIISSLGLWPLGTGPAAFWALGDFDPVYVNGGTAGFGLMRPGGAGGWTARFLPLTRIQDEGGSAVIADFNEDGLPDVAMGEPGTHLWKGHLLLGTAWGELDSAGSLPTLTTHFPRMATADFNRDGHGDLLALGTASLEVFLGDGRGGFVRGANQALAFRAEEAAVVDFDGDGRLDVVALHGPRAEVSLFRGGGEGSLEPWGRLAVGRGPSAAAVADLDRDGSPELMIAEAEDNTVSVYAVPPRPESGPFAAVACPLGPEADAAPVEIPAEPRVRLAVGPVTAPVLAVGDFDGDGRKDLAVSRPEGIRLLLNGGEGAWRTREVADSAGAKALSAGDLDGDGRAELALGLPGELRLLWNDAEGAFARREPWEYGFSALFKDLNGDGRVDLTVSLGAHCSGPVLRYTNLGGRRFREEPLVDHNIEGDGECEGTSAALAGDFNGDGTWDLVHNTLGLNLNPTARDGSSLPGHGFTLGFRFGQEAWVVDADADGHPDVVVRDAPWDSQLHFFPGDGHGTLREPFRCAPPTSGRLFTWEDVNGDGLADVVGESLDGQGLWVVPGVGGGRWGAPRHYPLGGPAEAVRGVDLLDDGRPELVVLLRSGELRVYPTP